MGAAVLEMIKLCVNELFGHWQMVIRKLIHDRVTKVSVILLLEAGKR